MAANQRDHYEVLGLDNKATEDDIKKNFRNLAREFHPDKNPDPGAEEKFKEMSAAYDTLKDGAKKKLYDMEQRTDELRRQNDKADKEREAKTKANGNGFSFTTSNGTNFTFRSTFCDDEDKYKDKENKSQENGTSKKRDTSKKYRGSKTYSFQKPDWDDDLTDSKSQKKGPKVSFNFKFKENPLNDFEEMFEDFLDDPFFSGLNSAEKRKKKKSNHQDDMWDWTKPLFGKNKAEELYEDAKSMQGPAKDYNPQMIRFPCTYCGKMYTAERVKRHEKTCSRLSNQTDDYSSSSYRPRSAKSEEREPSPTSSRRTWRDDFSSSNSYARPEKNGYKETPDPTRDTEFVKCMFCLREFSKKAADRHESRCEMRDLGPEKINPLDSGGKNYYTRQYQSSARPTSSRSSPGRESDASRKPTTPRAGGFSRTTGSRDYMDSPLDSSGSGLHSSTPRKPTTSKLNENELYTYSSYLPSISDHSAEVFDREAAKQPNPEAAYDRYQKRYYSDIEPKVKTTSSWRSAETYIPFIPTFETTAHQSTPTPSEHSTRSSSKDPADDPAEGPTIFVNSTNDGPTIHLRAEGSSRFTSKKSARPHVDLDDVPEEISFSQRQQNEEFAKARQFFRSKPAEKEDFSSKYLNSKGGATNGVGNGTTYTSSAYTPTSVPSSSSYASSSTSSDRYQPRYTDDSSTYRPSDHSYTRTSRLDANGPVIHLRTSSEPRYRNTGTGLSSSYSSSASSSPFVSSVRGSSGYTGTGYSSVYDSSPSSRPYSYTGYSSSIPSSSSYRPSASSYGSGSSSSYPTSYLSGSSSYGTSSSLYSGLPTYSNFADSYAGRAPSYRSTYSASVA